MATKKKKIDFMSIVAAAGAGAAYEGGIEAVSKKVDFVGENFLMVKAGGGALIGTALIYFGHGDKKMEAAGYGILGVGGAAAASKIAIMMQGDGDDGEPMQGRGKLRGKLKNALAKHPGARKLLNVAKQVTKMSIPGMAEHEMLKRGLDRVSRGRGREMFGRGVNFVAKSSGIPFDFTKIATHSLYNL